MEPETGTGTGTASSAVSASSFDPAAAAAAPADTDTDALQYDLGNLCAFHYDAQWENENELHILTQKNVEKIMHRMVRLPTHTMADGAVEIGRVATLPVVIEKVPREKSAPKIKTESKWEQFAKQKGIGKRKRERMLYDEEQKEYRPRFGYKRANGVDSMPVIIEHKNGDDPTLDPWTKAEREKKERRDKNKKQQLGNIKAASGKRLPGTIDITSVAGEKQYKQAAQKKQRNANHVDSTLAVLQRSTASMGKFDTHTHTHDEPSIKVKKPRRDAEIARDRNMEKSQNKTVLNEIFGREGSNKEHDSMNLEKAANIVKQRNEEEQRKNKHNRPVRRSTRR